MKRGAGGQGEISGEFSVGRIFGAATPPGARQDFWRSDAPRGASTFKKSTCTKKVTVVTVLNVFFAPHALACRRKVQRDLKILVTLRTAVLQVPSKFYENHRKRSGIVQLSRNQKKEKN